jgi:hypothetical protein
MDKYRQIPKCVIAEQWYPWKIIEPVSGRHFYGLVQRPDHMEIVNPGDWVVKDNNSYRILSDTEFRENFTPIKEP